MKKAAWILVLIMLFSFASARGEENGMGVEEAFLKSGESWNRVVTVLGKNYLIFAQNSPEWASLRCDNSDGTRKVHEYACIPFAFANAMVNVVPYEMLPLVANLLEYPMRIDRYSSVPFAGKRPVDRFEITETCDFLRYWPLVIVSMAAGNNKDMIDESAGSFFINTVSNLFQVKKTVSRDYDEAFAAMDQGALAIAYFYTETSDHRGVIGHYFVFAGKDEEYVYMLDSNFMKEYPMPMGRYIELIEPGIQRIRIADLSEVTLGELTILWPLEGFVPWTQESYQAVLDLSNHTAVSD